MLAANGFFISFPFRLPTAFDFSVVKLLICFRCIEVLSYLWRECPLLLTKFGGMEMREGVWEVRPSRREGGLTAFSEDSVV